MEKAMLRAAGLLLWLITTVPAHAAAASALDDAQDILARYKAATGADAWDRLRTRHVTGKLGAGGLSGVAEQWDDLRTGRTYGTFRLGPLSGAQGYDGSVAWTQDESGQSRAETTPDAVEASRSSAYRTTFSFWYPDRVPGTVEYLRQESIDAREYDVLRMLPAGGRSFDVWVNRETNLIDRLSEREATETRTETYSDYREVGGVRVPFAFRFSRGDSKYDQTFTVDAVEFNVPVDDARFAQPSPPLADYIFPAKQASVEVPFKVYNGHIYLQVRINGKGPLLMLFDSGGANILENRVARELGLKAEGALAGSGVGESKQDVGLTKVDTLEIGGIVVKSQVFSTLDLGDFARRVEGLDNVSGLVGYELFKRFPVMIDYQRSRAIFYDPQKFKYAGTGTRVPFRFKGHVPEVDGTIDGIAGAFDIDTGSRSSLDLAGPFVDKYGLVEKLDPRVRVVSGAGVGGRVYSLLARAQSLTLGGVRVDKPVTYLSRQEKGAFADAYIAGNVGYGVLSRFNVTFDYPHQQLFFEKNATYNLPDVADRSGMWLEQTDRGFEVFDVVAGGPADRAGVRAGDVIVAIDGRPTARWTLAEARMRLKSPVGTRVHVKLDGEKPRELEIALRDLV
jgi:hypothetical protein